MTKIPRRIADYLDLVESGTVPMCRDQLLLADYIRRVFQTENVHVDEDQLERYLSNQKYFPYRLLPWEVFCFALHNCTYTDTGALRFPVLFIMVGRGAGKNGYLAFEDFCLVTPINGIKHYSYVVYNKDQYRLTHLLEKGHNVPNNKRGKQRAAAYPHIAPLEERWNNEFVKRCEEAVQE